MCRAFGVVHVCVCVRVRACMSVCLLVCTFCSAATLQALSYTAQRSSHSSGRTLEITIVLSMVGTCSSRDVWCILVHGLALSFLPLDDNHIVCNFLPLLSCVYQYATRCEFSWHAYRCVSSWTWLPLCLLVDMAVGFRMAACLLYAFPVSLSSPFQSHSIVCRRASPCA